MDSRKRSDGRWIFAGGVMRHLAAAFRPVVWGSLILVPVLIAGASGQEIPFTRLHGQVRAVPGAFPDGRATRAAEELVELANRSRAAAGLQRLVWNEGLAAAAHDHAVLMAEAGAISHRYRGEADLGTRDAVAGARFSLIEENIAAGESAAQIHDGWMHSQGHRDNLLDPGIDSIGVGVVAARGALYVVADYAQTVRVLTPAQIESGVAGLLRARGLEVLEDVAVARRYCSSEAGGLASYRGGDGGDEPARFGMRWQSPDVSRLPQQLEAQIAGGRYHAVAVGGCRAAGADAGGTAFAAYRVGVLLY